MSFIFSPMGATVMAEQGQEWLMGTKFLRASDVEAPWGVGGAGGGGVETCSSFSVTRV